MEYSGERWIRLASLHPETVNYVDSYRKGTLIYTSYDEPYTVKFQTNWRQGGVKTSADDKEWKAVIHLRNGNVIERVPT